MNIELEVQSIAKQLKELKDHSLIKAVKEMLNYAKNQQDSYSLTPLTKEDLIARAEQSEKDIAAGNTYSLEEVIELSKKW
ncbi:MAG: hypothetical protein GY751_02475 [Bacteroidetes bacterium]|nr:hypothetical protein [Bacteroidota bacterium]